MVKTLITGAIHFTDELRSALENAGAEITFVQNELCELDIDVSDIEVVICNGLFLHNDIDKFLSLRYIQVTSAGLDRLPMDKILTKSIRLFNARGVYSIPMAEWAVGKILELYKKTGFFFNNRGTWVKNREIKELSGSKAAVVGFGSVGQEVAIRLKAFGVDIIPVDVIAEYTHIDMINTLLPEIDIVVLTLPLSDQTKELFNKEKFRCFKKGAILVNISRGGVVQENDLIEALKDGLLSGVALDVFDNEPLASNHPFWEMDNVIVTPHNSFVSDKNQIRLNRLLIENFKNYAE